VRAELASHPDHAPAYATLAVIHAYRGEEADVERAVDAGASVASDPADFRARLAPRLTWARETKLVDEQRLEGDSPLRR
jgi:hypothetical protein